MTELLASRWTVALAEALLHLMWQGAAITLLYEALHLAVGPMRPRVRYAMAAVALFMLPVCLAVTFTRLAGAPASNVRTASEVAPTLGASGVLVAAWWCGAAAMFVRLGVAWLRLRHLVASAERAVDHAWLAARDRLVARLGVARVVDVRASARAAVPMIVGVARPVILLPIELATGAPGPWIEAVVAHELVHLVRHDYLLNLVQSVVEALLFHHPAAWWLSHRMRTEREYCCDDGAARLLDDRFAYARALVELEQLRGTTWALAPGAAGGPLKKRIERMTNTSNACTTRGPAALGALALLTVVAAGLTSGAHAADAALRARWMPPAVRAHAAAFARAHERHGVDVDLMAAMVLIESGGDPEAVSPSGAAGLMQVMPKTAASIARARGCSVPTREGIFEPEQNIDFGAWYLARQLERFGDPRLAVAAYNAGPERVREHVERGTPLPEESARYADAVIALWSEREAASSRTFDGILDRMRSRAQKLAVPPVGLEKVTRHYGLQEDQRHHDGVDLAHPPGTPIHAPLSGVVRRVDDVGDTAYGRYVVVAHGRLETRYLHLDSVKVRAGDHVERGDVLGAVGNTGVSTGPHLHFEMRELGAPVDPALYFGPLGR